MLYSVNFLKAYFGGVATLAECPEKAALLRVTLLVTYGKIASWEADKLSGYPCQL